MSMSPKNRYPKRDYFTKPRPLIFTKPNRGRLEASGSLNSDNYGHIISLCAAQPSPKRVTRLIAQAPVSTSNRDFNRKLYRKAEEQIYESCNKSDMVSDKILVMAEEPEALEVTEDLVLKGSPLSDYLEKIGREDFECYPSTAESIKNFHEETISSNNEGAATVKMGLSNQLEKDSSSACSSSSFSKAKKNNNSLYGSLFHICDTSQILRSRLIWFLENLSEKFSKSDVFNGEVDDGFHGQEVTHRDKHDMFAEGNEQFLAQSSPILRAATILVLQISIALAFPLTSIFAKANLILVCLFFFYLFHKWYCFRNFTENCKDIVSACESFVSNCESLFKVVDKSILLIRECEVISMGLTFYHPNLPALKTGSRKRGRCSILRRSLYENILKCFEVLRNASGTMIDTLPEELRLFYKEESISVISIDEIKSSIGHDNLDFDCINSDILKSMICLVKSQIIELFEVTVTLLEKSFISKLQEGKIDPEFLLDMIFHIFGKDLQVHMNGFVKDIESKYTFTKENEFKEKSSKMRQYPARKTNNSQEQFHALLDSASLHLKASLGSIESLEEFLVEQNENRQSLEMENKSFHQKLEDIVILFNHDIDSAKDCVSAINDILQIQTESKHPLPHADCNDRSEISMTSPTLKFAYTDSEGDQLLEGISEPTQEIISKEQAPSMEEARLAKSQIRENKRVVNELKAIFSLKKSPVGLMPFELVRDNVNINLKESSDEEVTTEFVCEETENIKHFTFGDEAASNEEFSNDLSHDQTEAESENLDFRPAGSFPSIDVMSDLAKALASRRSTGQVVEQTLEINTFGSDDSEEDTGCDVNPN